MGAAYHTFITKLMLAFAMIASGQIVMGLASGAALSVTVPVVCLRERRAILYVIPGGRGLVKMPPRWLIRKSSVTGLV